MLKKRVIIAVGGIPLLVAAVWFDQPLPWFTVLVAIWGLLAAFEFYRMVAAAKVPPLTYFGLVWALLFILSPHFVYFTLSPLLLTTAVILPLIYLLWRPRKEAFASWVWTIAGILYLGLLLSHFVALRGLDMGRNWVFFALFTTFASDTAAFFIGRRFGRRKLAPHISPSKTWEGAIAGVLGAIIIGLCFIPPTPLSLPLNYGQAVLLGLLVSIFGQLGDLIESMLKRNMGVKDSSQLIPGHGGFLDRIDSVVFAGVVVYYYAIWVI
jgi:phosphatidate cytidylyltransferase